MKNTVMIADDKKANIDILTRILSPYFAVMAVTSGEMAIRAMEKKIPDLVLLDVYMPGMGGMSVLSHMKSNTQLAGIPVIFISGEYDSNVEEKALELGAVDYIKKPYNASIILYKVRNHLEYKNYRDHLETIVKERTQQLASSRAGIIMGMSLLSESHDKITGDHIGRIKLFTEILCHGIQYKYPGLIPDDNIDPIVLYSPLHDVGKVGIADVILKKAGELTPHEFDIMKTHTITGGKLLRKTEQFYKHDQDVDPLDVAIEIAECHHEKYDGSGYPNNLQGEDIPISARIVTVADVYDALRSPRPYKEAYTHTEACHIIMNGDCRTHPSHFDPIVLEAFNDVMDLFEKAYTADVIALARLGELS